MCTPWRLVMLGALALLLPIAITLVLDGSSSTALQVTFAAGYQEEDRVVTVESVSFSLFDRLLYYLLPNVLQGYIQGEQGDALTFQPVSLDQYLMLADETTGAHLKTWTEPKGLGLLPHIWQVQLDNRATREEAEAFLRVVYDGKPSPTADDAGLQYNSDGYEADEADDQPSRSVQQKQRAERKRNKGRRMGWSIEGELAKQ